MTSDFKEFEKTIKKKHSFSWTPKYQEEFDNQLEPEVFIAIAHRVFEALEWELVFTNENSTEAKIARFSTWSEQLIVKLDGKKALVKSVSLGNEMWDNGRNSKRVKLFIHAFQEIARDFDESAIAKLKEELEREATLADYEVPETLPQPGSLRFPNINVMVIGGLVLGLLVGVLWGLIVSSGFYFIVLMEFLTALCLGWAYKFLIKTANYTDFDILVKLGLGTVVVSFLTSQYTNYQWFLSETLMLDLSFGDYIWLRINAGLTLNDMELGWIGLLVSWAVQIWLTNLILKVRMGSVLISFQITRVPDEVTEFAYYHLANDKTEQAVRIELSKMGWKEKQHQDEVFEAIGGLYSAHQMESAQEE